MSTTPPRHDSQARPRSLTVRPDIGVKPPEIRFAFLQDTIIPGRINIITGVSGSGKTTILRQIASTPPQDLTDALKPGSPCTISVVTNSSDPWTPPDPQNRETVPDLNGDIATALLQIQDDPASTRLKDVLTHLRDETSFRNIRLDITDLTAKTLASWPTGHRIALRTLTQLVAGTAPESLALIDRPESGLHPSLETAVCAGIQTLLEQTDSVAIIATNSPIFIKETAAACVHTLRRYGSLTTADHPPIETFGESLSQIAHHVLGFDPLSGNHHNVIETLASRFTVEHIDGMFPYGMSSRARALVMLKQARDKQDAAEAESTPYGP